MRGIHPKIDKILMILRFELKLPQKKCVVVLHAVAEVVFGQKWILGKLNMIVLKLCCSISNASKSFKMFFYAAAYF